MIKKNNVLVFFILFYNYLLLLSIFCYDYMNDVNNIREANRNKKNHFSLDELIEANVNYKKVQMNPSDLSENKLKKFNKFKSFNTKAEKSQVITHRALFLTYSNCNYADFQFKKAILQHLPKNTKFSY